jgi:2-oxo-4-hydroxy-4-carboxy-5-ureidoimidazoline decarboxylase
LNPVLARWNGLSEEEAVAEILSCCGSRAWARKLTSLRPFTEEESLFRASEACWQSLTEEDWLEAFRSHPRIGEQHAQSETTATSAAWSRSEQGQMKDADADIVSQMRQGHRAYEERFGRIFIVCATGKQPAEMLAILEKRLKNAPDVELVESAAQQQQITQLRLRKWLTS